MTVRLLSSFFFVGITFASSAQEICNNALDDDGDGAIDLNDPDCLCTNAPHHGVASLLPNVSFEVRECCPFGFVSIFSPPWLSCATGWAQPTQSTPDYLHHCGYMLPEVVPQPMPDGDGCVGMISQPGYAEYIGKNLGVTPVQADTEYTFGFWMAASAMPGVPFSSTYNPGVYYTSPWKITVWGHPEEQVYPLPFMSCAGEQPGWVELGTVHVDPVQAWQPISITFTADAPMRSILLGPGCDLPSDYLAREDSVLVDSAYQYADFYPYLLVDELVLNETSYFTSGIIPSGWLGTNDLVLTAQLPQGGIMEQWYHNGVALLGSTAPTLDVSNTTNEGGRYSFTALVDGERYRADHRVDRRPSFTATPSSGVAPLEVTFVSHEPVTDPTWLFGDGGTAQGDTVVYIFNTPGVFAVSLTHPVDGTALTTTVDSTITVNVNTGLLDRYGLGRVQVVPNPVVDVLRAAPGDGYTQWQVLNALGQVVLQGAVLQGVLETAAPTVAGSYVLRMEGPAQVATTRFVKR